MHDKSQCYVYEQYALEMTKAIKTSKGFNIVSKQAERKAV
jgi:hypothetical protein